jgi:Holliday junction resolvase
MNSRQKGARGEREASKEWTKVFGISARRGQQFAGGTESPDIVTGMKGIHVEVKRCEIGNPYLWMEQAIRDAKDKAPIVLHRRNNKPWLLIVRLDDVPRLAQEITEATQGLGPRAIPDPVPRQVLSEEPPVHGGEPREL